MNNAVPMSPGSVPEWDLTDRMRKALRDARMTTTEIAAGLGVSRATVNRWVSGRSNPSHATIQAWAVITGAPAQWLLTGTSPHPSSGTTTAPRPVLTLVPPLT